VTLVNLRCIIYTAMVARLESEWPNRRETIIEKSGAGYGNVNNRRQLWRIEKGDCENRVQGACVVARTRVSPDVKMCRNARGWFGFFSSWLLRLEGVIWVSEAEANKIIKVKRYSCYTLFLSPSYSKDADDMVQPGVWARTV
jgi:hypothetical protein